MLPDHPYACNATGMLHVILYSLLSIPSYHYKEAQALQQSFEHYTVHLYAGMHVPHIIHIDRHLATLREGFFAASLRHMAHC